ncbi:MAG TPA: thiamine pyrophosphate-dependent dehydrogenase E1 component subunit alpha [Candidatus Cybelea sp.]|nr:thiamine pyrophosphate-dependent dehydrogenase E1 component subunit alpha [Candidatus Cybelea sp.]
MPPIANEHAACFGPLTHSYFRAQDFVAERATRKIVAIRQQAQSKAKSLFERHGLSDEQLVAMLRTMLMQRTLENRGFQLNRQGKIPFASASEGHEGVQAGAAMAFERGKDILVPYYRDLGLELGIGLTPYEVLLSLFARAADHSAGRQFPHHYASRRLGLHTISSVIAAQLPHAVGAACALQYRRENGRAVLTTFGDGATSEGEWHESINFAAVHKLPIVFLCENNEWAISTPLSLQMGQPDIYKRAEGYGLPGIVVDGMDAIACYASVKDAMTRARAGGGPTLVEAKCYRFLAHTTDDDDRTYRSREEVAERRKDDPVPRFERLLLEHSILTSEGVEALKRSVLEEVNDATDRAEAMAYPVAANLYDRVYAEGWQPWRE